MRQVLTSARRHWRLRSATALAAVGALLLASGGVLLAAPAIADGNNGTLKVLDAISELEFRNNEPKVCVFRFEGFDFDVGQTGDLVLMGQGQTTYYSDLGAETADATGYFVSGDYTLGNGHYKIEFRDSTGDEGKFKSKVFKVNCGQPAALREQVTDTSSDCVNGHGTRLGYTVKEYVWDPTADSGDGAWVLEPSSAWATEWGAWAYTAYTAEEYARLCTPSPPPPPTPTVLEELAPAVNFTDPTCEDLDGAGWDGTLQAVLDYEATGDVAAGETITVEATIETGLTDEYEFVDGAQTEFSHTFADVTLEDCVQGEETVVPKPDKPEPKPHKAPTVKGVEVVAPPAAPTAVAAGLAGESAPTTGQLLGQGLVGIGLALLVAAGWLGSPRRLRGAHQG